MVRLFYKQNFSDANQDFLVSLNNTHGLIKVKVMVCSHEVLNLSLDLSIFWKETKRLLTGGVNTMHVLREKHYHVSFFPSSFPSQYDLLEYKLALLLKSLLYVPIQRNEASALLTAHN